MFKHSDYPGIGAQNKGKGPAVAGAPASPLPLGSNSAAAPAPAASQGEVDYCPGGSEKECVNFCPPEEKVLEACTASCHKRCA